MKKLVKINILITLVILLSLQVYAKKSNVSNNNKFVDFYRVEYNNYHIKWNKVKGADKYLIIKTTSTGNITKRIKTDKTFIKEDIDNYYSYTYKIIALKKGKVLCSKEFTMKHKNPKIKSLKISQVKFNQVRISWKSNDISLKYKVYKIIDGQKILVKRLTSSKSYVDKDVELGKKYTYLVQPVLRFIDKDKNAVKGKSTKKSFTLSENKTYIENVKIKKHNVKLFIKKINGANTYRIYRKYNGNKWKSLHVVYNSNIYVDKVKNSGRYMYKVVAGKTEGKHTIWGKKNKEFKIVKVGAIPKYDTDFNINSELENNYDTSELTPIIGESSATVEQMVNYWRSTNSTYPQIYADLGAPTIEDFCEIVYDLSIEYGIRSEIFFAQISLETGNLTFTGDVSPEQCNFGGLGATGGVPGLSFKNVREGLLSQVQHLRMYADKDFVYDPGNNVDKRFQASLIGKMPYLEWFTISKNPYHVGWATSLTYKEKVMNTVEKILSY